MTESQAWQKRVRAMGVYKPFVTESDGTWWIESYPLSARVEWMYDKNIGRYYEVKVTDEGLKRLEGDVYLPRVFTVTLGEDLLAVVGRVLLTLHPEAYARAKEQDRAAIQLAKMNAKARREDYGPVA